MLESMRTDHTAGFLTGLFGMAMMGFATFGLFGVFAQRVVLASIGPIPISPDGLDFEAAAAAIHGLFLTFLPLQFVVGLLFAICGWQIYRGSRAARRFAQALACIGIGGCAAYAWSCASLLEKFDQLSPFSKFSPELSFIFEGVMILITFLMSASFPAGLLVILRAPKHPASSQPEPTPPVVKNSVPS